MKQFNLPDLGEGLREATILKWHVQEGDMVHLDQLLVTVETAKASVDVPSPFKGKIIKLNGNENETVLTGTPLLEFMGEGYIDEPQAHQGIVGTMEKERGIFDASILIPTNKVQATPEARAVARKLKINLQNLPHRNKWITPDDVLAYHAKSFQAKQPLTSLRLAMARNLMRTTIEVVPSTCFEEVNISQWSKEQDISLRVLQAIGNACSSVPIINAHFDYASLSYSLNEMVNIGMALGTDQGLFMPVLKDIKNRGPNDIRNALNVFKEKAKQKSFTKEDLEGATILYSNFGTLGTRYATPVIIPPIVAIIGTGKIFEKPALYEGELRTDRFLPITLTINHMLITGAEASQFMKIMIKELSI